MASSLFIPRQAMYSRLSSPPRENVLDTAKDGLSIEPRSLSGIWGCQP
ncbi:hypothetical protein [Nostoc sp.]